MASTPKTILITGCSAGGLGAAITLALAKQTHHVFATARDVNKIPEELRALSNVTAFPLDVTTEYWRVINQVAEGEMTPDAAAHDMGDFIARRAH